MKIQNLYPKMAYFTDKKFPIFYTKTVKNNSVAHLDIKSIEQELSRKIKCSSPGL